MKTNNFLWKGCTGLNALVGYVTQGEPVIINDKNIQNRLLSAGQIEPLEFKTPKEPKNARRKKETRTEAEELSGSAAATREDVE